MNQPQSSDSVPTSDTPQTGNTEANIRRSLPQGPENVGYFSPDIAAPPKTLESIQRRRFQSWTPGTVIAVGLVLIAAIILGLIVRDWIFIKMARSAAATQVREMYYNPH